MTIDDVIDNTGKGKDRKGTLRDGLRYKWRWVMRRQLSGGADSDTRRLPCQSCFAETHTPLGWWRFEAVDWHSSYEARAKLDNRIAIHEDGLPTRLEAQRRAEVLAIEFCERALVELKAGSTSGG